jgi:hypothetical protein
MTMYYVYDTNKAQSFTYELVVILIFYLWNVLYQCDIEFELWIMNSIELLLTCFIFVWNSNSNGNLNASPKP